LQKTSGLSSPKCVIVFFIKIKLCAKNGNIRVLLKEINKKNKQVKAIMTVGRIIGNYPIYTQQTNTISTPINNYHQFLLKQNLSLTAQQPCSSFYATLPQTHQTPGHLQTPVYKQTKKLNDGSIIYFNTENGIPHGDTQLVYRNGNILIFKYGKGVAQGNATLYFSNDEELMFHYKNGVAEGKATHKFNNGDEEYFQFKNDKANGPAKHVFSNRATLDFIYKDEQVEGNATFTSSNKSFTLKFAFKDDKPEGDAILTLSNNLEVKLSFKDGKLNNQCTLNGAVGTIISQDHKYIAYFTNSYIELPLDQILLW
jgi:antitoxin component YwqK of YwqJK toxin-antitoxin module